MLVFWLPMPHAGDELQFPIREYLAWKYVRDNADGVLNPDRPAAPAKPPSTAVERADRTAKRTGCSAPPLGYCPAPATRSRPAITQPEAIRRRRKPRQPGR